MQSLTMKKIQPHLKSALTTSMIIGVILSIINHTDELAKGITISCLIEWIPNFIVPFCVSLYSRVSAAKNCE